MFVACEGEWDSIPLSVSEGDGGAVNVLAADASKREFGGTSTNVLSANYTSQMSLIWLLAQPVEDSTFCAMRPSTQGVRDKKGGGPSKPRRPKVQVRHRTAYPDDTPASWGTPPYNPRTG